jgi:hypothetical protein
MGHGIFPNYGFQYHKTIFGLLSKAEKKAVFFPEKRKKSVGQANASYNEEEAPKPKKKR